MEPVRFRADEILYAQSTLTPNCAASCAKAPLPASYAPRSFCRRSLLYAFAISTTSTNAKRLQRISLYTFWKFALIMAALLRRNIREQPQALVFTLDRTPSPLQQILKRQFATLLQGIPVHDRECFQPFRRHDLRGSARRGVGLSKEQWERSGRTARCDGRHDLADEDK